MKIYPCPKCGRRIRGPAHVRHENSCSGVRQRAGRRTKTKQRRKIRTGRVHISPLGAFIRKEVHDALADALLGQ